jgi:predicted ATPase
VIGRRAELLAAQGLLQQGVRLLTLWGPPGIGKTTLAAALHLGSHERKPLRVSLTGVASLDGLVAAVAGALSDRSAEPDPARLAGQLLVLDNLEHLLEAEADAVVRRLSSWLEDARGLQIVATSRRLLRMSEEHALALEPLPPDDGLQLFLSQVQRQKPGWQPTPAEHEELGQLVGMLDGIPLAIELAAARWELLGTAGLVERLAEPLQILARPRSFDPRHLTLRSAIAWSWELLSPTEQRALCAFSWFEGRFDVSDAEVLLRHTDPGLTALDALESLRDGALVQVPRAGTFVLLAAVRAFARERTQPPELEARHEAHARWCLARTVDPDASPPPSLRDDLYAAARRLVDRADPRADQLLAALGTVAPGRHLELLDKAVGQLDSAGAWRARGRALRLWGRTDEALRDLTEALARAPDVRTGGQLWRELGAIHHAPRRLAEARDCYERALAAHREAGDARAEAITVGNLGALDHDACRYEDAEVRYDDALRELRALGDRRHEAIFLANQAVLRQDQGQLAAAEGAYRRALALQEEEGDLRMQAITLGNLGLLLHELGRLPEALALHEEAARRFADVADPASEALCLARLGAARAATGDLAGAHQAHERAIRVAAPVRDPLTADLVTLFQAFVALAEGRPDEVDRRIREARRLVELSGDARVAVRLLRAAVPASSAEILEVGPDWFLPPGGHRQDLSRHASCRRMFHALVAAHAQHSGRALTIESLFEVGWPGEQISPESMRNRVHVNLARLRSLGLKQLLVRTEQGYHLDPGVLVRSGS